MTTSDITNAHRPVVLFCVSSLGLGHATRTLPIIRAFLDDHEVHVMSAGDALTLLKTEIASHPVTFHECREYPPLQRGVGIMYVLHLIVDSLKTVWAIHNEHTFVMELARTIKPDYIISDGRYGAYLKGVPSFLISHQISFLTPKRVAWFRALVDRVNAHFLRKFDRVFIPDYEDEQFSLAGNLSHVSTLERIPHEYIGILSSLERQDTPRDIDTLFSVGGFLSRHKPDRTQKLLGHAQELTGATAFILGNMGSEEERFAPSNVDVYASVTGDLRQQLFSRAQFVVTRGGYTTIMDLVELGIPGHLLPTEGQVEQEYLAEYLQAKNLFTATSFDTLTPSHIEQARTQVGVVLVPSRTKEAVSRVRAIVTASARSTFISIVIPAHNEEKYLGETLACIQHLNYPHDRFEVLVVENGSTDGTLAVARESAGDNVTVYTSPKGVSRAKNIGLSNISEESEWVVFLDADTHLAPSFLSEVDHFMRDRRNRAYTVGTTVVYPWGNTSRTACAWFVFYNIGHWLTKTSFSIVLMKASLRDRVRFDESVEFAEDLTFMHELEAYGRFLFLRTKAVATSTRRFDTIGWVRLFFRWNWEAVVLSRTKHKTDPYQVIR
jgi:uncharacterized protein (TIGR00661 family)